ncbi:MULTISPECIES: DUF3325 domain-containing protein [unclassified Cupriavidus]|uniref:DUF3325 domain-containing protein n=1 Tax=unclassified Cupriavidus TaxID=2640874 RepID=UPI001F2F56B6|nr:MULTISPECIES: DUF3325 domain-containing protein [unclassified Cupriavidus]
MSDVGMLPIGPACVAGLGFAVAGFTWLATAMDRHHADMFGRGTSPEPARARRLRWQGAFALALALAACVLAEGWAFGVVYWGGLLTLGALTVAGTFSWAPHASPRVARTAVIVGVLATTLSPLLAPVHG